MNDARYDYGMSAFYALKKGTDTEDQNKIHSASAAPGERLTADGVVPVSSDEEESIDVKEKKRKSIKSLIKLIVIGACIIIVIIISTIAWFTMNREVENNGLSMTATGQLFSISPMPSPYLVGIFDDSTQTDTYVRDKLLSGASKDSDVMTWTITNDVATTDPMTNKTTITPGKNIGNGPAAGESAGIVPGSSGELDFKIIPNGSVDAEFNFYLYGYSVNYDDQGEELKNTITIIGDGANSEKISARNLLNGHILLFENYNEQTGKYSDLISSDEDFDRLMTGTYSSETTVKVYWVWVETLSELILDDTNDAHKRNLRGKKSLCTDQSETIEFLKNNPSWFFLDPENPNKTWTEFTENTANAAVISTVNNNYTLYSSYYNEADQCIGTNVAYLMLDMSADGTATPAS